MPKFINLQKKLLNARDVCEIYRISRVTLWRRVKAGQIPPPTTINSRNYWLAEEIEDHIDNLMGGGDAA
jgi:predicted DNA-binding transcriptional regulator AlpA